MIHKLLVLMVVALLALSLGCAKRAAKVRPAGAAGAAGAATPAGAPAVAPVPGAEAMPPGTAPGLTAEELAAQRLAAAQAARASFETNDIHFDFDKYDITPEAAAILDGKADYLKANAGARALIEGHCDERGTNEYNLALGERRANAAKKYLVTAGIDPTRLDTVTYGEERPVDTGHSEGSRK